MVAEIDVITRTNVSAMPNRTAVATFFVTPKNEHSPRNITSVKLFTSAAESRIKR
jgi:hypothetical protein